MFEDLWFDDLVFDDLWFDDLVFEDLWFGDLVFEDLRFDGLVFEDLWFEDLVFEDLWLMTRCFRTCASLFCGLDLVDDWVVSTPKPISVNNADQETHRPTFPLLPPKPWVIIELVT